MKKILITLTVITSAFFVSNNALSQSNDKTAIEQLIQQYGSVLNASDITKVLELYAEDAVFMPSAAPTSAGKEQIGSAYKHVFSTIAPNLTFKILEITLMDKNNAIVRSESSGTVTLKAGNQTVPDANRELFVIKKENGAWKIARYMFNKTQ